MKSFNHGAASGRKSPWVGAGLRIAIHEVGPRDGLQAETLFVPTGDKIALVNALSHTGVTQIEVTAFVSPQAVPALRDAETVLREIERVPSVVYSALVPNVRGAERAIEAAAEELNVVMSASETHNLSNLRMTRVQSFFALSDVNTLARQAGVPLNVSISCAFGCPMEGTVPQHVVLEWCQRIQDDLAPYGITLCDTTGMAYPAQVAELVCMFRARWPSTELTLHFHNTRGLGLANVLAGIDAGARRIDASLGGVGGCPYAPGATGNVCTEEIVHALDLMGYRTGVDQTRLLQAASHLQALLGKDLPSQILKAGPRLTCHPLPADFAAVRQRALARVDAYNNLPKETP
jgi:hydroxymethylglutaryl-CoA lyase